MTRPFVTTLATALVITVLVAGCGDSSDDASDDTGDETTEQTTDETTEPSADDTDGTPTPAEISDALLVVTDMDGTWEESQRQVFEVRSVENPSIDPSTWCPEASVLGERLVELAGQTGADVEMQSDVGSGGARFMRLQAWSSPNATAYLAAVTEAVNLCAGVESTDEIGITTATEIVETPTLGDESISWTTRQIPPAETQDEKFEALGRTTVARFGDVVMVLQIGDFNTTGTTELMDDDEWWAIVEAAGAKLEPIAG